MLYLSGSVMHTGTGIIIGEFAVLPGSDWPGIDLFFPVFTSGGAEGALAIHGSGSMNLVGGQSTVNTSLAGISFPLTPKLSKLTLVNGWRQVHSGDPSVSRSNGVVYLSGAMSQPSGTRRASPH